MGQDPLRELRHLVLDDPALRNRLLAVKDRQPFIAAVVAVGHERGIETTADQVLEGLAAARQWRFQRWV